MNKYEICLLIGLVIGVGLTIVLKYFTNQRMMTCLFTGIFAGLGLVFIPVFCTNFFTTPPDKIGAWVLGLWLAGAFGYALYMIISIERSWIAFLWGFARGTAIAAGIVIFIVIAILGSLGTSNNDDPYDDYWD